jgi:putative phosphoesterase
VKILIISDLHANIEALSVVASVERPFDHVFCNGDIVDYGPSPHECIAWLRDHNAKIVRGNHDHAVGAHAECGCVPPFLRLSRATREVMWKLLDGKEQSWLANLPMTASQTIDGVTFYQCHAAPTMISRYLPPETPERDWRQLFGDVFADFILLGHTHIQMDQIIAGRRFVNPGSVGQPKPQGQMAQYAVWQDGDVHLKSVSYNHQKTQSKIRALPLEPDVIDELCWILEHGTLQGFK